LRKKYFGIWSRVSHNNNNWNIRGLIWPVDSGIMCFLVHSLLEVDCTWNTTGLTHGEIASQTTYLEGELTADDVVEGTSLMLSALDLNPFSPAGVWGGE